jgi:diacylglycerol kinase family enzyme
MSVCRIQVNTPNSVEGVNLMPGTYPGEEHRRPPFDQQEADDVTYTMQLPVDSSGDGTIGSVRSVDVTALIRSGALTVIL